MFQLCPCTRLRTRPAAAPASPLGKCFGLLSSSLPSSRTGRELQKAGLCCSRRVRLVHSLSPLPEAALCCTITDGDLHSPGTFQRVSVLGFPPVAALHPSVRPSVLAAPLTPAHLAVRGAVTLEAAVGSGWAAGSPWDEARGSSCPPHRERPPGLARGCWQCRGSPNELPSCTETHPTITQL